MPEFTVDNVTDPVWGVPIGLGHLTNTHPATACTGRECFIHAPTEHHMRSWPTTWRGDTGVLERRCPHGVGHPDPDQFAYWEEVGTEWKKRHGCCGCCHAYPPEVELQLSGVQSGDREGKEDTHDPDREDHRSVPLGGRSGRQRQP